MRKIQKLAGRCVSWLLCAAISLGCFSSGLSPMAWAAEDEYETIKAWTFDNDTEGWAYNEGWTDNSVKNTAVPTVSWESGMLKADVNYSGAESESWAKTGIQLWSNEGLALQGAKRVTLNFLYEPEKLTDGAFAVQTYLQVNGGNSFSGTADVVTVAQKGTADESGRVMATVSVSLENSVGADAINGFTVCVIGKNTTYNGTIWLDNIKVEKSVNSGVPVTPTELPVAWTFDDGIEGWSSGGTWSNGTNQVPEGVYSHDSGSLKVEVDYSNSAEASWAEVKADYQDANGFYLTGANQMTIDVIFNADGMNGGLALKVASDNIFEINQTVELSEAVDFGNGLKKVSVAATCDPIPGKVISKMTIGIVGKNTTYKGPIWLDNIIFDVAVVEDLYVDSTVMPNTATTVSGSADALTVNGQNYPYATAVQLVDPNATEATVALYQYLKAAGESSGALFGHMEDTVLKAGSADLSESDTKDLTGSLAAINGLDCGGLFSGFVGKYNARHSDQLSESTENDIKAAALLSNEAIAEGAIMTLSSHMPNFAYAEEKNASAAKTYDRYSYPVDSYTLTGDCMNQILPGGSFNSQFTAYLDLVAEYAGQVNGPILFRPFHENTGSWFWWGKAFCDAETYKSVFRYTVEYLRDEKNIHNLLYLYGPGSEAATITEYEERYPGDEYVDMVGFDTYDDQASKDGYTFQNNFEATVRLTDQFAKEHKKLFAVTETGITNAAMKKQGNERPEWFTEILDIVTKSDYNCAYYMVWSNYSSDGNYYMPFAISRAEDGTLHGHELMDPFIRFYNDQRTIFASDQKAVLSGAKPIVPEITEWGVTGYFVAPNGGSRILAATEITANISAETQGIVISVSNGTTEIPLATTVAGRTVSATLTADILAQLGEAANGKISLRYGTATLAEISVIFNIQPKEPDPYMVDDFESYYGADTMLTAAWATNKATGSTITLTLDDADAQDGYAMKFEYTEQSGGWAGATINKSVNWSDCNALQFWTIPDGKQQKAVIQIEANTCYEVYLNEYDEYNTRAGQPTLVTIPFSEFRQRDTAGNPKGGLVQDCGSVSSFGLWVNAIDNEFLADGTVSGTIWYDNITAVATDKTQPAFENPGSNPPTPVDPDPVDPVPPTPQVFTIDASAGTGGTITPTGRVTVSNGGSQSFVFAPNTGYTILDVTVDGVSVGTGSSYTFENVTADHTISVDFTLAAGPVYPIPPDGSGGSSGSSGSSGSDAPDVSNSDPATQTPSQPTTTTTTDPITGTVTETTKSPDGTTVTKMTLTDGSTSNTVVTATRKTEISVELSAEVVAAAQRTGEVVILPMPKVSVSKDSDRAPTVTVNADGSTGTVKVEIPVSGGTPGTVAVLVKPDGTEEVIKTSVATVSGLTVAVENGGVIKILDRSKTFADTDSHWSADAVAFVSARELFLGTGTNTFSPNEPMTRAMLATVLARLDGVDTSGGATWYEKGIKWAVENSVSDGSNPGSEITREQLAVMLYRYAGSPASSGNLNNFADAGTVSGYAQAAMRWAAEHGIITGKPGNILDPQGSATRAEVSTMLMRFCSELA